VKKAEKEEERERERERERRDRGALFPGDGIAHGDMHDTGD